MTDKTPAYSRAHRARILLLAGVLPIVIAGAGVLLILSWAPDLPDPIAVHWGAGGGPDGYGPLWLLVGVIGAAVVIFATLVSVSVALMTAPMRDRSTGRFLVATSVWLAVFLTIGIGGAIAVQRGLRDAADAGAVGGILAVATLIAFAAATGVWFLTPRPRIVDAAAEGVPPMLTLAADERVLWQRSVGPSAVPMIAIGVAILLVAGAIALQLVVQDGGGGVVIAPIVVVIVVGLTLYWRVRIDNSAVMVRAVLGVPRFRHSISDITSARAIDVSALGEFGGWGIRWGGKGRMGVIMRAGEALEISLSSGRSLVITVDDASTAARLINGLVARRSAAVPEG
ncbi:MAG: DUF1648 domain-containing protein [Microbacteriaceae bacterium]